MENQENEGPQDFHKRDGAAVGSLLHRKVKRLITEEKQALCLYKRRRKYHKEYISL